MNDSAPGKEYPRADVTGMVLAGGRGARLGGVDKGLVEIAGRPMIEHALAALEPQAATILVNANRSAARYARYGHRVIADRLEGFEGPLAGMASGLAAAATEFVLVVPCDSPLVEADLGPRLYAALIASEATVSVAHDGERMHPVFVLMRRSVRDRLHAFLARGERKIDRWFGAERLAVADFSDRARMFMNVNRPEDRSRVEAMLLAEPDRHHPDASSAGNPARTRWPIPVVGFAGFSGSGKTTLLTAVVRSLARDGVRVAVVKHAHHGFDVDQPGKDSYELRRAGAQQMLVGSRQRWALVTETEMEREPTLEELVDRLDLESADVVLVEGFKNARFPKIAVAREPARLLADDPFVVAAATPEGAAVETGTLPRLDLDRPREVARFIVERFLAA